MAGVYIVTDSSSDLTEDDIGPLDIEVVPLTVRFGDVEFTDGRDLSIDEFYRRMAGSEELPQTACPSPGAFEAAFRRGVDGGSGAVVCITISGDLSNTVESARTAAAGFESSVPIHVIDSRSVSSGLGTLVLAAGEAASNGAEADAVVDLVNGMIPRTHVFAALNTLENLRKGGRIGGAKAMLGSVLSIKPIIDITGGVVHEAGRARTRKRAMHLLFERMLGAGRIENLAVMHGKAPDIGEFLDLIASRFPRDSIRVGVLGAVIGSHGGAEILGTSWTEAP